MNIKIKTKGLTKEERELLMNTVKGINRKRRHDKMPRLLYKMKLR